MVFDAWYNLAPHSHSHAHVLLLLLLLQVFDAWYNLAPHCPQLYLYSGADPLVDSRDVEKFMAIQVSLVAIQVKCMTM